ncbi:MAG: hypothetical protein IT449_00385 [Phycisphaerales bacterium]|nr:hypothetical protein [Phycisphaerales bacterium]
MTTPLDKHSALRQFAFHPRDWRRNLYVYPVVSRRSGGVSVGVNLNPDKACNFDCIYCQVDRSTPPRVRDVDLHGLRTELRAMLDCVRCGSLFQEPEFADLPEALRSLRDIAFSGDGEPTTCKVFAEAVRVAADLKRELNLPEVKLVLITDAAYLSRPAVEAGLAVMDEAGGEIWAKLDAGTQGYYERINRPNVSLEHVVGEIAAAARRRPVVIQSLFMRVDGAGPDEPEITAYVDRLEAIVRAGGRIDRVQVYTVARRPAERSVTPLSPAEVDHVAARVAGETGLRVEAYYGPSEL